MEISREKQIEDQSEILYGGSRRGGRFFAELYEQAMRDAEAHPENYNDIFEGYENNLDKAVALIECQKQEIVSLTIINKAYGLAVKRLAAERSEQSEVVRCKDCEHFYQDGNVKICRHWNCHSTKDDAYCSYAKMKGGAE